MNRKALRLVLLLCLLSLCTGIAMAGSAKRLYHIDPEGGADFETFQEAMDEAKALVLLDYMTPLDRVAFMFAPGHYVITEYDMTGIKGADIIGVGGAGVTFFEQDPPCCEDWALPMLYLDDNDIRIEGISLGGLLGPTLMTPIYRLSSSTGPVELRISKCRFNGDIGTIQWLENHAAGGDYVDISQSSVEYVPGIDNYSLFMGDDTPERLRVSGCNFLNIGTHADILQLDTASTGLRVVEFTGNTVLMSGVGVEDDIPVITVRAATTGSDIFFYGVGNAISLDLDATISSGDAGAFLFGANWATGHVQAVLTGNTIAVRTPAGVNGYGIRVDGGAQLVATANDISIEGDGTSSTAYGIWTNDGASGGVTPAVARSLGNRVRTSVGGNPGIDLKQEGNTTLTATATSYVTSSGTIGGDLRIAMETGANKCVGSGTITTGGSCVTVSSTCITAASMPFLQLKSSPTNNPGLRLSSVSAGSFDACTVTGSAPSSSVTFNWFLIN